MRTPSLAPSLALVLALVAGAPAALAGPAEDADQHIAAAKVAHEQGNFTAALAELEAAFAIDPRRELLFAIGQVHAPQRDRD